ncbi:MAG TPA: O-antigen ligase family protein [Verrucomicrobiae bacterium]|nr:O-antigen ligase family protein [Verrucomicrobiae bacterium]
MDRETLDEWCERGILALVLGILVFAPLALGAVEAWAFLVVQALTIGVMGLWALRLWTSPRRKLLWPPLCWVVLAFAIYAVARYLTADIEYVARQELIQVLMYAFLFFAIVNNLYRQEYAQVISFTLIFLAMGIAAYAGFQYFTHSPHVWNYDALYPGRGTGTFISPNNLAGFLEMILPLAVAYLLAGRITPVMRIVLGYSALVIAAGIILTFSRGGWVAAGLALLTLLGILICHRQHQLPAFLLLLCLVGGGAIVTAKYLTRSPTYVQRVRPTLEDNMTSSDLLDMRRNMWAAAEEMWRANFWWGVGPAHYNYRFPAYRIEHVQRQPDRAHNDYLNLLADWGTTGGVITLAGMTLFGAGLWQTRRHVRRVEKEFKSGASNRLAFFLGAATGLLALAAHSAVDFNLHIPANAILGVTLLALLSSNLRFATEKFWFNLRLPLKILATLVITAGIAYLSWQEFQGGREALWLARAEQLPNFSPARIAALEKAFAAEPQNFMTAYAIGECYRTQSFDGGVDSEQLANAAMPWFERTWKLDPYYAYSYLRYGMCLDWLERHDEAGPFFSRAEACDPNNYFTTANIGWHYVQAGDWAAARSWLQRSLRLQWQDNPIARSYLELAEQKLLSNASGQNPFRAGF